jgi:hypothetical protein
VITALIKSCVAPAVPVINTASTSILPEANAL